MYKRQVIAGKEYGTGSSRDWAAKGPNLLGVKAVIAHSYERIHRSNLIGMGVMPTEFMDNDSFESLGLNGSEYFSFEEVNGSTKPMSILKVNARRDDNFEINFNVKLRIDTEVEKKYLLNGGVLQFVLRNMVQNN